MAEHPADDEPPVAAQKHSKRRWFQFSLRTLMIFTLICAVASAWLGIKIDQKRKEREAVAAIGKLGGKVAYDYDWIIGGKPPGPDWLRHLFGENIFSEVVEVDLLAASNVTDAELEHLKALTHLQSLNLTGARITDAGLANVERLTELQTLVLDQNQRH